MVSYIDNMKTKQVKYETYFVTSKLSTKLFEISNDYKKNISQIHQTEPKNDSLLRIITSHRPDEKNNPTPWCLS